MELVKASFDGKELVFTELKENKLVEVLKKCGINACLSPRGLSIPVESADEAREMYAKVAKALVKTPYIRGLGFSFREVLGYSFLVYLSEYRDGIEDEVLNNPLSRDFDIVTLPNRDGFYYSTHYGMDNVNIPVLLSVGNLFVKELLKIVENNPSLTELIELKKISENVLRLERFGDSRLAELARCVEKIEAIEDTVRKMLAVRLAFSCDTVVSGNVEHSEVQKVRRLGNGLCVYFNRTLRDKISIKEGDMVSVNVLGKKIFIEKLKN